MNKYLVYGGLALGLGTIATVSMCGDDDAAAQYEKGEVLLQVKESVSHTPNLARGLLGIDSLDKISLKHNVKWVEKVFDTVHSS